jgi:dTDP-4-amino-4,6-dideoxygalactose transaminase
MFGQAADLRELTALGLPVIEDCAQSLGSRYLDKMTGSYGVLSIFSFYATKLLATGEGGMVMSSDERLMDDIRDLRDYDEKDDDRLRYNYKMTDIQAALGRSQRKRLPDFLERRQAIAQRYDQALQDVGVPVSLRQRDREHIYYRYILEHRQAQSLIRAMNERGIACRRPIYRPLHHYLGRTDFPITERAWQHTLSIPIYPALQDGDITYIEETLKTVLKRGL